MPLTLPDPDRQSRSIEQPQTQIIAPRTTPRESAEGIDEIGQGLQRIGAAIKGYDIQRKTRESEMAFASANSQYQVKLIELQSSFDRDDNYQTFDTRYTEAAQKIQEELSQTIEDDVLRQNFVNTSDVVSARGRVNVLGMAKDREIDTNRAIIDNTLEASLNAMVATKDDVIRAEIRGDVMDLLTTAKENEYLKAQEAEDFLDKFDGDSALVRIHAADARTQLEYLKQPWAQQIVPGTREQIRERAQKVVDAENFEADVMRQYQKAMGKPSLADQHASADRLKDPKKSQRVHQMIDQHWARQERIAQEAMNELGATISSDVYNSESPEDAWRNVPEMVKTNMHPTDVAALEKYAYEAKRPSDIQQRINWSYVVENPQTLLRMTPAQRYQQLPKDRWGEMEKAVKEMKGGGRAFGTEAQSNAVIKNKIKQHLEVPGRKATSRDQRNFIEGVMLEKWDQDIANYKALNEDNYPPKDEMNEMAKSITSEYSKDREGWWNELWKIKTVVRGVDVPDEDIEKIINMAAEKGDVFTINEARRYWLVKNGFSEVER